MKDMKLVMNQIFCGNENSKDRYAWKNEKQYTDFLDFITLYLENHSSLISNDFYYIANIPNLYNPFDCEMFLKSLYKFVNKYAKKHDLPCNHDTSYYIKIDNVVYNIELIMGLGTCIEFSKVTNPDKVSYIDYDEMMKEL